MHRHNILQPDGLCLGNIMNVLADVILALEEQVNAEYTLFLSACCIPSMRLWSILSPIQMASGVCIFFTERGMQF